MKVDHELKTIDPYFGSVVRGTKTFEVRKNDRDFRAGQLLKLNQYFPIGKEGVYSGCSIMVRVTYFLKGEQWGIMEGFCILGIEKIKYK